MNMKKTPAISRRKRRKNQEEWRQGVWRIPSHLLDAVQTNNQQRVIVEKSRRQPLIV
jgi:hypothetical protein